MNERKIIVESHIPFVGDELSAVARVERLSPEEITPSAVADADALIVRTRTRCDASLLAGSKVRFVATATIGTDHIDKDFCASRGIRMVSAPGCNAPAVAQYVWASILSLRKDVEGLTIGVIGLGHVGSIVARWARALGVKVLACDPPRQRTDGGWNAAEPILAGAEPFAGLAEIARGADIITFHTPHTRTGVDATHHLADAGFFASLMRRPMVINAARGPIIDTEAALAAAGSGKVAELVVDCWEGEPAVNPRLLAQAAIATPHIAGYSIEGKQRASAAVVAAALDFFGVQPDCPVSAARIKALTSRVMANAPSSDPTHEITPANILASYNPLADTASMRSGFTPERFESLRNHYTLRHEL